jgi:hypothetical protein
LTQADAYTGKRSHLKVELKKGKTVILEYKDNNYVDITKDYFS